MAQPKPTAAEALYGHLPRKDYSAKQQPAQSSLANAMWPQLSDKAKAMDQLREQRRQNLLKGLRELNARLEGKR